MLKYIQKTLKAIMKLLKDRRVQGGILIIAVILCIIICMRKEGFQIIDLIVPPLEQVSCDEYAYGCRINGYRVDPVMIYKCSLQGKDNKEDKKYLKYKIIDSNNVVRYSGLYNDLEGVKKGEYITFENGQEYIISTLDIVSQPQACATIRHRSLKK